MTSSAIALMAALAAPSTAALEIGQPAPAVRAKNQDGEVVEHPLREGATENLPVKVVHAVRVQNLERALVVQRAVGK